MNDLTQEEVDQMYAAKERARKKAIAEQAREDNGKLAYPKDYRGIRYYRTQYSTFVIPDAPKQLEGMHTSAVQLHRLIDAYVDKQEG